MKYYISVTFDILNSFFENFANSFQCNYEYLVRNNVYSLNIGKNEVHIKYELSLGHISMFY